MATDEDGEVVQTLDYYPYGSQRIASGSFYEQRRFIGEEYDGDTEFSYLNARYYQGSRGQFMSQDPLFLALGDPGRVTQMTQLDLRAILADPQASNSYSYARNNPITLKDPEGEFFGPGSLVSKLVFYAFTGYGFADFGVEFIALRSQLASDGNLSASDLQKLSVSLSKEIFQEAICGVLCDIYESFSDIAGSSPKPNIQVTVMGTFIARARSLSIAICIGRSELRPCDEP